MPFSFSRLFLGKKATSIDEDSLPCQPREIVPVAVDANPFTSKTKFGLTKIGRALKHKFQLNTTHAVPAGHGPLVIAADEPFSPFTPFSQCLQSPATPSLRSLPHIPDVSSTLRRDIRHATRFALIAAAGEANSQASNNDIYNTTPCRKRQTRSSSVLGGSELPRPGTPLGLETLEPQYAGYEPNALDSPVPAYLLTPIDSPAIWQGDDLSTDSSEYNEVPDILPLGINGAQAQNLQPFVGLAAIAEAFPSPSRNWFTQQYLQTNANWSMPVMSASYPASSVYDSLPALPKLDFGTRESLPGSSVYSSFIPAHDGDTRSSNHEFFSGEESQPAAYSPAKLEEQANIFPHTQIQSPPAEISAREAQLHSTIKASKNETVKSTSVAQIEASFDSAEAGEQSARSSKNLTHLLEPRPILPEFNKIAGILEYTSEFDLENVAAHGAEMSEHKSNGGVAHLVSTGNVLGYRPKDNTQRFRRESLVLRQLIEHASGIVLQRGPENQVQIQAARSSRIVADYDLFGSEKQHSSIEMVNKLTYNSSSVVDDSRETSMTDSKQISSTKPSSPVLDDLKYPSNAKVYGNASAHSPGSVDVVEPSSTPAGSPHKVESSSTPAGYPQKKQVNFAQFRRVITARGTMTEENEENHELTETQNEGQGSKNAALLSRFKDLKENWHHDDQDFLHIGEHVLGHEMSEKDIARNNATKDAVTFLQIHLAYAYNKVKNIKSLERALDLRHQSHIDATEQVAQLSKDLSNLRDTEAARKVVFDRMISNMLVDIASKDKELETLRELCNREPVTKELADLHEALRASRAEKVVYLQHAEESIKLLKRADDRQAQAEQEAQSANFAKTFAEINQQNAEHYHEDLKERIAELESERDQAVEARNLALAEAERCQNECAAAAVGLARPQASTTPTGSPPGYRECHDHATSDVGELEKWESELDSEGEFGAPTEGITEELEEHDWDDSEIF